MDEAAVERGCAWGIIQQRYLYDNKGKWVGWFHQDAVDTHGRYLGTLVGDRLFRKSLAPYRGYPGFAGGVSLPAGYSDIAESSLSR